MIKLSILIATMPSRKSSLDELVKSLWRQGKSNFEILWDNSMDYNVGIKRNKLLDRASGEYVVFIDDDDHISDNYIAKIIGATDTNPDCIGISGIITTNGKNKRQWHISKDYGRWYEAKSIYYRTPNHISPVKRELAIQAGFPEISYGEDAEYSKRLLPLLKTEVKVKGNIYHYDFRTK